MNAAVTVCSSIRAMALSKAHYSIVEKLHTHCPPIRTNVKTSSMGTKVECEKLVELVGPIKNRIVQLSLFLAKIDDHDGMNNVLETYFPWWTGARTTVTVATLLGNSLVEINCVAARLKK